MNDVENLLIWDTFSGYMFKEDTHEYFYFGEKVDISVTSFISMFYEKFDKEKVALMYSRKHGLDYQSVLDDWEKTSNIASTLGTIIHAKMEQLFNGKVFNIDYSTAEKLNVLEDVKSAVEELEPIALDFFNTYRDILVPIKMEYTVGYGTKLAGNIDLICYNKKTEQFEIWDYKNCKEISSENKYGKKCLSEFRDYPECNLVKYSIQLHIYKFLLERKLGIKIGACRLVHIDKQNLTYKILNCIDLSKEVESALNRLLGGL